MNGKLPESDWKYLCSIKDDLLAALLRDVNRRSMEILSRAGEDEVSKYGKLFDHMHESDKVVAACFDDWRRSTLLMRLFSLQRHHVIGEAVVHNLSEEAQKKLRVVQ